MNPELTRRAFIQGLAAACGAIALNPLGALAQAAQAPAATFEDWRDLLLDELRFRYGAENVWTREFDYGHLWAVAVRVPSGKRLAYMVKKQLPQTKEAIHALTHSLVSAFALRGT